MASSATPGAHGDLRNSKLAARPRSRRLALNGLCVAAASALIAAAAVAQQSTPPSNALAETYVSAEAIDKAAPDYPERALRDGLEGWVRVSFIISEEGRVIEPMIEESSNAAFDESTLRAVRGWRYKPATLGGKPVEESMVQTVIGYTLSQSNGARASFIGNYRSVLHSIEAKNFAKADSTLKALEKTGLNLYEQSLFAWLTFDYLSSSGTGDAAAQMSALDEALGGGDYFLPPNLFVLASRQLYTLRANDADLSGAATVFERLKASRAAQRSKLYKDTVAALQPSYDELQSLVAGPKVLQQIAHIGPHGYWVHRLLRRSFAFGDVQGGELEVVDLRCTRTNRRFVSAPEDAVLRVPDSWGDCAVYIKGDVGTSFAFEDYPDGYANAVDPDQFPLAKK